jgi:hypothetical protein
MYINRERFKQIINDISQAIKDFANSILELANKVIDSLRGIAAMFPNMDTGTLKKPVFNRPEYKHIKPNTKPYSAYKRLYRVQVR